MYLKHENVFQIHKIHANCISITKYKLLLLSKQNTKTKYMKRISITCISITIQHCLSEATPKCVLSPKNVTNTIFTAIILRQV